MKFASQMCDLAVGERFGTLLFSLFQRLCYPVLCVIVCPINPILATSFVVSHGNASRHISNCHWGNIAFPLKSYVFTFFVAFCAGNVASDPASKRNH